MAIISQKLKDDDGEKEEEYMRERGKIARNKLAKKRSTESLHVFEPRKHFSERKRNQLLAAAAAAAATQITAKAHNFLRNVSI